jgi:hypothetical protein
MKEKANSKQGPRHLLEERIKEAIEEATFNDNNTLGIEILSKLNGVEGILPERKIKFLSTRISDNPIRDFVDSNIFYDLRTRRSYDPTTKTKKLTSISPYSNSLQIAVELTDKLYNIQTDKYEVFFDLGSAGEYLVPYIQKKILLSECAEIVWFTEEETHQFQVPSYLIEKTYGLLSIYTFAIKPGQAYLKIYCDGYLCRLGGSIQKKLSEIYKTCLLILNTYNVFSLSGRANLSNNKFLAFKKYSENIIFHDYLYIEKDTRSTLPYVEIHPYFEDISSLDKIDYLHKVGNFSKKFDKLGDKIKCAARWLFNSHLAESQLLSYIQAMTSIETLLGDISYNSTVGIRKIISNRLAYAIANSANERSMILEKFEQIYITRNKIVHEGCETLEADEMKNLELLQYYIHCYLQYEISLLPE